MGTTWNAERAENTRCGRMMVLGLVSFDIERREMLGIKSKPENAEGAENTRCGRVVGAENRLTEAIIGAAIEVHRHLGPGLPESVYEECLCYELNAAGLRFGRQVCLPIRYKGVKLQSAYKADLIVEDEVVVEIKAADGPSQLQASQLLTYLKVSGLNLGLLINLQRPDAEQRGEKNRKPIRRPEARWQFRPAASRSGRGVNMPKLQCESRSLCGLPEETRVSQHPPRSQVLTLSAKMFSVLSPRRRKAALECAVRSASLRQRESAQECYIQPHRSLRNAAKVS